MRMLFQLNSNLPIAHAAAIPNTVFSGTTIAAIDERQPDRGKRIGVPETREIEPRSPFRRQLRKRYASGANRSAARNSNDTPMNAHLMSEPTTCRGPGGSAISASSAF